GRSPGPRSDRPALPGQGSGAPVSRRAEPGKGLGKLPNQTSMERRNRGRLVALPRGSNRSRGPQLGKPRGYWSLESENSSNFTVNGFAEVLTAAIPTCTFAGSPTLMALTGNHSWPSWL